MQIYGENDETVLWSSGTRRRPTPSPEGGNERLARVTFGGNSIVESCEVIERCGSWSSRACFPSLPSNLPSSLSSSLAPCHSAPFPALLINKADSLSALQRGLPRRPSKRRRSCLSLATMDRPTGERREELTNFQQVFSRFAAI